MRRFTCEALERLVAGRRFDDGVALVLEEQPEEHAEVVVVFHHENTREHHSILTGVSCAKSSPT